MKKFFFFFFIIGALSIWGSNTKSADLYFVSTPMANNVSCYGPSVGDLDGDGDLDMYCINHAKGYGYLYLNNGDGTFFRSNLGNALYDNNRSTEMYDFDNDGDLDIYVSARGYGFILQNDGLANFTIHYFTAPHIGRLTWGQAIADFNMDGYLDIYQPGVNAGSVGNRMIMSSSVGSGWGANGDYINGYTYSILTGDDKGMFPAAGDLNGDGYPDIYAPSSVPGGSNRLFFNDGYGNFILQPLTGHTIHGSIAKASIGDLNGDGYLDIYVGDYDGGHNKLYLNNGSGDFTMTIISTGDIDGGRYPSLIDIDQDGDLDIFVNSSASLGASSYFWINDGSGNFTMYSIPGQGAGIYGSAFGDFDNNGLIDVWTPGRGLRLQKYPVSIEITAPTKIMSGSITDTTIRVFGSGGIDVNNITIGTGTSVNATGLNCIAVNAVEANCTLQIVDTGGGDVLEMHVIDDAGTVGVQNESGYIIDAIPPEVPNISVNTTSPYSIDDPEISFSSVDYGIGLDYCEVIYKEDDGIGGTLTGTDTIISPATSPVILSLDPDEQPVHTVTVTCYDKVGNSSTNSIAFPPIVSFTTPTTISNSPITDATVTITSPGGNDIDDIVMNSGISPTPTLLNCIGNGGDTTAPYASPVICQISDIEASGSLEVSARDIVTNGIGKNTVSFVIDTVPPTITISSPTLISHTGITDTTITVFDDRFIYATGIQLGTGTTAIVSNFSCLQISPIQVDCTLQIDDDGDIVINARDVAGNEVNGSQTNYIIDTVYPIIILSGSIPANAITGVVIGAIATDDIFLNTGTFSYGLSTDNICDNADIYDYPYIPGDSIEFTDSMYNGQYLCFMVQDHVGNTSYEGFANPLLIDDMPPTVSIIGPISGSIINTTSTGFVFTGNDDIGPITYQCQINTGAWTSCTSLHPLNNLSNGSYIISVYAIDGAANMSTVETTTFTVQLPTGGGGGSAPKDNCPNGDYSPSYYDGICGTSPTTGAVDEDTFNPSIGSTCFTPLSKKTIYQGNDVSEAFKIAHQMLYSYKLTMWRGTADYRPYDYLTREEAARFMVEFAENVLCRTKTRTYEDNFSDIGSANGTLTKFIIASYEYEIFNGDKAEDSSATTFRPRDRISNDELTAIMVRLVTNTILDEPEDDWANPYRVTLSRYARVSRLNDRGRGNIAEVIYDLYRNNQYELKNVGYVIK